MQITLPERLPFSTELEVRVGDLNYGGHLGHDAVLTLMHEARVRFFARLGATELDCFGARIVIAAAAVVYRAEARLGDRLACSLGLGPLARAACPVGYRLARAADGAEIAIATTDVVFLGEGGRPCAIPEGFRRAWSALC